MVDLAEVTCPNEGCGHVVADAWGYRARLAKHKRRCDQATPAQRAARMVAVKGMSRSGWKLASVRGAR